MGSRYIEVQSGPGCKCRCGRMVHVTQNRHGQVDGLMHEMPPCTDFISRDVVEFVSFLVDDLKKRTN